MRLLAIDTSSSATVLGLRVDGDDTVRTMPADNSHSREVLPRIMELLDDTGTTLDTLDAIAYGQGPGSFTGLRIAVGVVQGLAYGLGIPAVPVSTMAIMAYGNHAVNGIEQQLVVQVARKQEVFYGGYRINAEGLRALIPEGLCDVTALPTLPAGNWAGIGSGFGFIDEIRAATGAALPEVATASEIDGNALLELAAAALQRGETVTAAAAVPEYLREEVASKPS